MSILSRAIPAACLAMFFASFGGAALAQGRQPRGADDCVLDNCGQRPGTRAPRDTLHLPGQRGPARNAPPAAEDEDDKEAPPAPQREGSVFRRGPSASTGRFDFYVLSLSWSSGFCATNERGSGGEQCRPGSGLGFVVHGLWPQYERGFPSNCDASARPPTRAALESTRGLFPDEGLARYEWRKHGTCSGKSATDYFADVRFAREKIRIPKEFEALKSEERIGPSDITRAFEEANPRLRPGMMAVGCTRGVLQEVRICMTKDLRDFRPCPEVARNSCRSREIRVPPVR